MTRRYYISKVMTITSEDGIERTVAASRHGLIVALNLQLTPTGEPLSSWALCVLESNNHAAAIADQDNYQLPQFSLDVKVAAMNNATKAAMLSAFTRMGIDTAFVSSADGFRDVVRGLGRMHNPYFDENSGSWQI